MNKTEDLITAIAVRGFKSIYDELRMELRPLTILAGANSSGKSSLMQPVLLLKQTLESPFDPGVFRLDGPNVRFTSTDQLLSKVPGRPETTSFSVGFDKGGGAKLGLTYRKAEGMAFEIESMDYPDASLPRRPGEHLSDEQAQQMLLDP